MPKKNDLRSFKQEAATNVSLTLDASSGKPTKKPKVMRVNKGFQVEIKRARQWDILVAHMKGAEEKKTGPELIDEALDYLFEKYLIS